MSQTLARKKKSRTAAQIIVALIVAISGIIVALVGLLPKLNFNSDTLLASHHPVGTGRLSGSLTDRAGTPISNINVSIRSGSETVTDIQGNFTLNEIPVGDQILVVRPPSNHGSLTQTISIERDKTTQTKVVYDAGTSSLGILSITDPVDGALLDVRSDGADHWAMIHGRCDGLIQVLRSFDVWVLVTSERDSRLWVQHPSAVVDPNSNTWRAKVVIGSSQHPARDGEYWNIVAVAANSESDIGRIANTPRLSLLPPHVSSNVVTVETANFKPGRSVVP